MLKTVGSQVVRISRDHAIVKRWCKEDVLGKTKKNHVFYDICEYQDGEVGEHLKSFVTLRAAVKCLFS